MKGLSLTQPWATLVANGSKKIETRSWSTTHRGVLAIHASKGFPGWAKDECYSQIFQRHLRQNESDQFYVKDMIKSLPLGAIVAIAGVATCGSTNYPLIFGLDKTYQRPAKDTPEYAFGDYSSNRWMWFLEDVIALPEPIPCRGALSLWDVPADVEERILATATASALPTTVE